MLRSTTWMAAFSAALLTAGLLSAKEPAEQAKAENPDGREIFERVWTANDPRSHGGDGLGPVFNANSCVACHDQGGAGGGGALDKNVHLLSVTMPALPVAPGPLPTATVVAPNGTTTIVETEPVPPNAEAPVVLPAGAEVAVDPEVAKKQFEQALAVARANRADIRAKLVKRLHPEFGTADTVVLHAKGIDEKAHSEWRGRVTAGQLRQLGVSGNIQLQDSFILPVQQVQQPVQILNGPVNFNPVQSGLVFSGFVDSNSFPLLAEMQAQLGTLKSQGHNGLSVATAFEGGAALRTAQRQTTALWGAGWIDSIPDDAIEALAAAQAKSGGRVSGRPSRLEDGKIGRFGWKGQKASLHDFTVAACANELGLEVPGAHQATVAYQPKYEPKGLDLDEAELDALVGYIASLPTPRVVEPKAAEETTDASIEEHGTNGRELFASVGCAACHVENVGEVEGLFSDLLLHDMGADLGSVGSYGVPMTPEPDPQDVPVASADENAKPIPPTSREWRTAPLWGVASSAPYLHDGRAKTLEQAIAFHGGEASESRLRFMLLNPAEKERLMTFLDSLVAPEVASRE